VNNLNEQKLGERIEKVKRELDIQKERAREISPLK